MNRSAFPRSISAFGICAFSAILFFGAWPRFSFAQQVIYSEDFSTVPLQTGLSGSNMNPPTDPVRVGKGTAYPGTTMLANGDWFRVADVTGGGINVDNGLIAKETDGLVRWESDPIDISCFRDVYFSLVVYGNNQGEFLPFPDETDLVSVSYKLDGGPEALLSLESHGLPGTAFTRTVSSNLDLDLNLCGIDRVRELVIVVSVLNTDDNERHGFDNVQVFGTPASLSVTDIQVNNCDGANPTLTFSATSDCELEYRAAGATGFTAVGLNDGDFILHIPSFPYSVTVRDRQFPDCAAFSISVTQADGMCEAVLPIALAGFTGRPEAQGVRLRWYTEAEEDNDYMAVERSADGVDFDEIGRVQGRGTTAARQDYTFFDAYPAPGVNYYRLRQVDFDGATEYHPVIAVRIAETGRLALSAFPNPADDLLRVRWNAPSARDARLRLLGLRGEVLLERVLAAGAGVERLSLAGFPAGVYFLQLIQGETVETIRVVRR